MKLSAPIAAALVLAAPTFAQKPAPPPVTINVELKEVLFADALRVVFRAAGAEYLVLETLPESHVTLSARELPLQAVVERILATSPTPLSATVQGKMWTIRRATPIDASERTQILPLSNVDADTITPQVRPLLPAGVRKVNPLAQENALLAVGTEAGLSELRNIVRHLDVAAKAVQVKLEVAQVEARKRTVLFAPTIITHNNTSARISTQFTNAPGKPHSIVATLTPHTYGDNTIGVTVKCTFSVPIPTKEKGTVVRLEKEIDTEVRGKPGEAVTLGTTDLTRWGIAGKIVVTVASTLAK